MANGSWQISGQYMETCSCSFLCPCPASSLTAQPTEGHCNFAMVFHVEKGQYANTSLDGINFALVGHTPGVMAEGNWSVGLIVDSRADAEQQQAVTAIASGQAGGPVSVVAPLIGNFWGVETGAFEVEFDKMRASVAVDGLLDQAVEGVPGANPEEPQYLDNTPHPANSRLGLATATRSHLHAFGLDWDVDGGGNNGHLAPFGWSTG